MTDPTDHNDTIHYEAKPNGGLRIECGEVTIDLDRDTIARAESEGGFGMNVALTAEEHEALTPPVSDSVDSPIESITEFGFQIQPRGAVQGDNPREDSDE